MKVAVFHNLPSGGAKRALHGFVKHFAQAGWVVDVFIPSTADEGFLSLKTWARTVRVFPVQPTLGGAFTSTIRHLPPLGSYRYPLADLERTQKRMAAAIDGGEYDIALIEQDRYTMSPFLLKFLDTPHIYYCQQPCRFNEAILRTLSQSYRGVTGLARRLGFWYAGRKVPPIDRQNALHAKHILANSHFSKEVISRAYGVNATVCYLGIDTETFRPLNLPRENYVLSVGHLGLSKGYEFLVKALGLLEPSRRPRLVIASNAVYRPWQRYLQRLAKEQDVRLDLRVLPSDDELVQLHNRARLFVYAPHLVPFGLAPLEAMACGTPVVAVKEGGFQEAIVDGETGVLTDRNEGVFANAISTLLRDGARRAWLGERGVEAVREFWTAEHAGHRLRAHLRHAMTQ